MQDGAWLFYQTNQGTIFCDRGCSEETVSWTLRQVFSSSQVDHVEVDVDYAVYSIFVD